MIPAVVLAVDFMNFTYKTNPCSENVPVPVVMRKGKFSYFDKQNAADFDLHVDSVKEGSLADRTRQAVVILACDFPSNGGTAAAYAFDERKNTAVLLRQVATASWGSDWGAGPDSMRVRFANHYLYVEHCKDDECTAKIVTKYMLRQGKLVAIAALPARAGSVR